MFIKKVGGKRHPVPHFPADKIHNRSSGDFAHNVQTGNFNGTENMNQFSLVPWRISPLGSGLFAEMVFKYLPNGIQLKRIFSQNQLSCGLQVSIDADITWNFTDSGNIVVSHQCDNGPQRIRRVKASSVEQWRISNGYGSDVYFLDHWARLTGIFFIDHI